MLKIHFPWRFFGRSCKTVLTKSVNFYSASDSFRVLGPSRLLATRNIVHKDYQRAPHVNQTPSATQMRRESEDARRVNFYQAHIRVHVKQIWHGIKLLYSVAKLAVVAAMAAMVLKAVWSYHTHKQRLQQILEKIQEQFPSWRQRQQQKSKKLPQKLAQQKQQLGQRRQQISQRLW